MKKFFFLTLFNLCLSIYGQTTTHFQLFRKNILDNYQQFRKSVLDDYTKYLESAWKNYDSFRGIERTLTPKPQNPPNIEITPNPKIPNDKPIVNNPSDESLNAPFAQPTFPSSAVPISSPQFVPETVLTFYGTSIGVPKVKCISVTNMDGKELARVWKQYHENKTEKVIITIKNLTNAFGLNDWFIYEFVRECVNNQNKNNSSIDKIALQHFILTNMGYDVRIAKQGNIPIILIPFKQKMYSRCYVKIKGINYYEFDVNGKDHENRESIYTCDIPDEVELGIPIDLRIHSAIKLSSGKSHNCHLSWKDIQIYADVDEGLMEMFRHYPQMDISHYAASILSQNVRNKTIAQLRPYIQGLSECEAANKLLHFVQHAFDYATDQKQHGYEKCYFFEENFYYPQNDCEDRAVFYAYLIHKLLGLDVLLIQYPGHECTAVHFNDKKINGHGYIYNGQKYLICDPTYIGADIGMCMPNYINNKPKIETIQ